MLKCPGGEGEGRRDLSGKEEGRGLLRVHAILIYRAYFGLDGYAPLIRLWISGGEEFSACTNFFFSPSACAGFFFFFR